MRCYRTSQQKQLFQVTETRQQHLKMDTFAKTLALNYKHRLTNVGLLWICTISTSSCLFHQLLTVRPRLGDVGFVAMEVVSKLLSFWEIMTLPPVAAKSSKWLIMLVYDIVPSTDNKGVMGRSQHVSFLIMLFLHPYSCFICESHPKERCRLLFVENKPDRFRISGSQSYNLSHLLEY